MAIETPARRCRHRAGPSSPWSAGDRYRTIVEQQRPEGVEAPTAGEGAPERVPRRIRAVLAVGACVGAVLAAPPIDGLTSAVIRTVTIRLPLPSW